MKKVPVTRVVTTVEASESPPPARSRRRSATMPLSLTGVRDEFRASGLSHLLRYR
jgi:hypothetical protein